jgi:hypothetical protein
MVVIAESASCGRSSAGSTAGVADMVEIDIGRKAFADRGGLSRSPACGWRSTTASSSA